GEIRQAAARSPDAVAVVDEERGEMTYAALLASSERAAHVLLTLGLMPLVSRQALPREVRIVDELPRNATGKVLVDELRKQFLAD
ncbi:MAG TPA: hypothetical protein VJN29_08075, partial [Intrasporangium sp.]|nr:hypothetical protein [Intrasporangium sp.]